MPTSAGVQSAFGVAISSATRLGGSELGFYRVDDLLVLGETTVAIHTVHQLAIDRDVERAFIPRHQLDRAETMRERLHQRLGERERLWLVAALGAVRNGDLGAVRRVA